MPFVIVLNRCPAGRLRTTGRAAKSAAPNPACRGTAPAGGPCRRRPRPAHGTGRRILRSAVARVDRCSCDLKLRRESQRPFAVSLTLVQVAGPNADRRARACRNLRPHGAPVGERKVGLLGLKRSWLSMSLHKRDAAGRTSRGVPGPRSAAGTGPAWRRPRWRLSRRVAARRAWQLSQTRSTAVALSCQQRAGFSGVELRDRWHLCTGRSGHGDGGSAARQSALWCHGRLLAASIPITVARAAARTVSSKMTGIFAGRLKIGLPLIR